MAATKRPTDNELTTVDYSPSSIQWNIELVAARPRKIFIKTLDTGFKVKVGCKEIAVTSVETLIKHLTAYLNEPEKTEKAYKDGKLKF